MTAPAATCHSRQVCFATQANSLTCPSDKVQVYYTDRSIAGLRLKVPRNGKRRVWDWRRSGTTKMIGVFDPAGRVGIDAETARNRAVAFNRDLAAGADARAAALTPDAARTVKGLFDRYEAARFPDQVRFRGKRNESKLNLRSQTKPLLDRYADLPAIDLTREVVVSVLRGHHLAGDRAGWTIGSARQMIGWIKSAWQWGMDTNVLPKQGRGGAPWQNPALRLVGVERDLAKPKLPRGQKRGYPVDLLDEEAAALMEAFERARVAWRPRRKRRQGDEHAIRNPSGYLILEFALYTGCRKSEAAYLHLADVRGDHADVQETVASLHGDKTAQARDDGEMREIFLGEEARRVLALASEWRKAIGYAGALVFPSPTGKPCSTINHSMNTALEIAKPLGLKRRLTVHSLRAAYINYAARCGVPIDVVSKNVGHTDVGTTMQYYREVHDRTREAANATVNARFGELRARFAADVPLAAVDFWIPFLAGP